MDDNIYFEPNNPNNSGDDYSDSTRSHDIDEQVTVDLAGFFDDLDDDYDYETASARTSSSRSTAASKPDKTAKPIKAARPAQTGFRRETKSAGGSSGAAGTRASRTSGNSSGTSGSGASKAGTSRADESFFGDDGGYSGDDTPRAGGYAGRKPSRKKGGRLKLSDLTERPEFYGAAMLLLGAVLMVIVGAIIAGNLSREKASTVTELEPAAGRRGGIAQKDGANQNGGASQNGGLNQSAGGLYEVLGAYRDFADYEQSVREEIKGGQDVAPADATGNSVPGGADATGIDAAQPDGTPPGDGAPNLDAEPADTNAGPDGAPTAAPSDGNTQEEPGGTKLVPGTGEDYYIFDLSGEKPASRKLAAGDTYSSGVGTDTAGELVVGPDGKDLDLGWLRIQNPYNAPGFGLRDILATPLIIEKNKAAGSPSVLFYYTHTSEAYCTTPDERTIRSFPSLASYETEKNVVGRGITAADAVRAKGVGTLYMGDKNDEDYNKAYERSAALADYAIRHNSTLKLALDIHVNTFEYPTGKRYSPTVQADGKTYARILFVVSQNDELPCWRDNIKLAMLLCEKLNEKVPGITLGISLRKEAKYNASGFANSLLTEIGFDGNLVEEADNTAALLGTILGEIYG